MEGYLEISDEDVQSKLKMEDAISAIERVLLELADGKALNCPRVAIDTEVGVFRFMAAHAPSLGLVGVHQGFWTSEFHEEKSRARASGILSVYDSRSGKLLALVRTGYLNEVRTGAVSAVAAKYLSHPDSRRLGLIGSGGQARCQVMGVCAVRQVERVRVFSPTKENRERFCRDMSRELDVDFEAVESPRDAVEDAEIVLEATDASTPVLDGRHLEEGSYVSSIKTGRRGSRQLDDWTVKRSRLFVIDFKEQAIADGAGDVIGPIRQGYLDWGRVVELGDVIAKKDRRPDDGIGLTVFKSCGMALNDIALAATMLDHREDMGAGGRRRTRRRG